MLIVDRFEGRYAICECEDGTHIHIARDLLLNTVQEGDALDSWEDMFVTDMAQTSSRKSRIREKMEYLFSRESN